MMDDAYPELRRRREFILETLTAEEERFGRTISSGLVLLNQALEEERAGQMLPGEVAFTLYDSFGFPLDLTQKIAAERGYEVDLPGFNREMDEQRARGRAGAQFKRDVEGEIWGEQDLPNTEFSGYTDLTGKGQILALLVDGDSASAAQEGEAVQIVVDRTPFYAQGGGQVGDTGILLGPNGSVRVEDTQRPVPGLIVHYGRVEQGSIALGDTVEAQVDVERRRDIQRNHTATHLLHR